jgi:ABC-type transport system substrate-binding protein
MLGQQWPNLYPSSDIDAAREQLRLSRYGEADQVPPIAIYAADIAAVESIRDVAASELGLGIEAIRVPWLDFLDGLAERRFPAYSLYWGADYPDPESMIEMLFGSSSPDNYTGYNNAELDALLDAARNGDDDERIEIFAQTNQLLIDDAALIPLHHPTGYTLLREGLGGVEVTPMGIIGLESILEIT